MSKDDDNEDHGDADGWMARIIMRIMRIDGWDENVHPFRTQP